MGKTGCGLRGAASQRAEQPEMSHLCEFVFCVQQVFHKLIILSHTVAFLLHFLIMSTGAVNSNKINPRVCSIISTVRSTLSYLSVHKHNPAPSEGQKAGSESELRQRGSTLTGCCRMCAWQNVLLFILEPMLTGQSSNTACSLAHVRLQCHIILRFGISAKIFLFVLCINSQIDIAGVFHCGFNFYICRL